MSRPVVTLAVVVLALAGVVAGCRDVRPGGDDRGNKTSTVIYRVTGHGTADVQYAATATADLTTKHGVALPWQATVTTTDHSGTVYRVVAAGGTGMGCGIEVNGVNVRATERDTSAGVDCSFIK